MRRSILQLTLACAALISMPVSAVTWHVPAKAPTIQEGINLASAGDTVLVDCGTYFEHDIVMKSGITLLSETGEADCVTIDAQKQGRVLYCEGVSEGTLVKGFTLTNGHTDPDAPIMSGGGICCVDHSSPTFESCMILNNWGVGGGGVFCDNHSSPTFDTCMIRSNASFFDYGGGMLCRNYCLPTLIEVTFENNAASGFEGGPVGGLACMNSSVPRLTDCAFIGNNADMPAAALYCDSGSPIFERVLFQRNESTGIRPGSAMVCLSETATLIDVLFFDNTCNHALELVGCTSATLDRVTFASNNSGGACFTGCSPTVSNCTFYGNWYGLDCMEGAAPTIERTLFALSVYAPAIYFCDPSSHPVLECCDIFGNEGGDWVGCIEDQYGINGNISEDPLFCSPDEGDLSLHSDSPCAAENNPECGQIGAFGIGCGPSAAVSINPELQNIPSLHSASPNPFTRSTRIAYSIPGREEASRVSLSVYDPAGRLIRTLLSSEQPPGTHAVVWDGTNQSCAPVAAGVYFFQLMMNGEKQTRRMTLVR